MNLKQLVTSQLSFPLLLYQNIRYKWQGFLTDIWTLPVTEPTMSKHWKKRNSKCWPVASNHPCLLISTPPYFPQAMYLSQSPSSPSARKKSALSVCLL